MNFLTKCLVLTGRQIMYQTFSFFNIHTTEEHTLNMNDVPNVELYNDILKMFNQAWEETLLAPGDDLDEHVLDNWYEMQVTKFTLIKNARDEGPW